MEAITTDWTREEFKAYILIYAAQSNFFETEEEKEFIQSRVSRETYKKIHRELDHDNDYQSIQKILYNLEKFEYSRKETERLVKNIQKVFLADGEIDLLESNFYRALKRLLEAS